MKIRGLPFAKKPGIIAPVPSPGVRCQAIAGESGSRLVVEPRDAGRSGLRCVAGLLILSAVPHGYLHEN